MRWEHQSVLIHRTGIEDRVPHWRADFIDPFDGTRQAIDGVWEVLDYFGGQGWELTTLTVEAYDQPEGLSVAAWLARVYRATFKRQVEEPSGG